VSYGTGNVIADRGTGDRVHFDPAARVIRAGETECPDLVAKESLGKKLMGKIDKREMKEE